MKITLHKTLAFFIATMMLTTSCQKDKQEENLNSGKGTITLKIDGTSFAKLGDNKSLQSSNSKKSSVSSLAVQHQEVSFNDEYNVSATLTAVSESQSALRGSKRAESVSNGAVTEPLEKGVKYQVLYTKKGGGTTYGKSFTHGVDDSDISFNLESGEYTFRAYDIVQNYDDNRIFWKKDIKVIEGQKLNLNIVFQKVFAQATVTLNAEDIGPIQFIYGLYVYPVFNNPFVNTDTGIVTYTGLGGSKSMLRDPVSPGSRVWTSNPLVLKTNSNKFEIELVDVKINGIVGTINLPNLTIEDGVKYDLQLKLGSKKTDKTFKISGLEFAQANLYYNWTSKAHYFKDEQAYYYGGHFFPNYVMPRRTNDNNAPNLAMNGSNGDPCELVLPLNTWRLPTKSEIEVLLQNNKTVLSNFHNSLESGPFNKMKGVFFGTETRPSDRYKFLYLWFRGYYIGGEFGNDDESGRYLLKDGTNGYAQLALSLNTSQGVRSLTGEPHIIDNVPENMALSVRCVKK